MIEVKIKRREPVRALAEALIFIVSRQGAAAMSSRTPSCRLHRPARSWSPAAAVLAASACRRIDLAPDRSLMRRASPSAERRRPTANRSRQWAATTTVRSPHRRPRQAAQKLYHTAGALALAHLHTRIAIVERLIPDETNRYAGRKARNQAPARPNDQVSIRRALAGIPHRDAPACHLA